MKSLSSNKVKVMPVSDHLFELKIRSFACFITFILIFTISYFYSTQIYKILLQPLINVMGNEVERKLIYTDLTEAFFTYMKLSFYSALIISMPFFLLQIYMFIAPGLYKYEKKQLALLTVLTPILFYLGGLMVYFYIFPLAWKFFLSFETIGSGDVSIPIQLEARISEYLSIVIQLIFAFGVAFQTPVIIILLAKFGFITVETLKKKRRLAIVIIFAIAAVITPPDIVSQIALALPMIVLYEISIIITRWIIKEKEQHA